MSDPQQPVVDIPRRTETGEAPGDQGARRANIGNIQPTSNAERRDASPVECSGMSTTDCQASTTLSYAAYAEIPADGQRWEFLDGEVFVTPAPSPLHQFAVQELWHFLRSNLAAFGHEAIAFVSPIDVILNDAEIVQPDVVVAHREQVSGRGIEGAPLLLVEVLSPARPSLDRDVKARRYAANGVERFWLVDPAARTVECFDLVEGRYVPVAGAGGTETLAIAPGLQLELARLWMP